MRITKGEREREMPVIYVTDDDGVESSDFEENSRNFLDFSFV